MRRPWLASLPRYKIGVAGSIFLPDEEGINNTAGAGANVVAPRLAMFFHPIGQCDQISFVLPVCFTIPPTNTIRSFHVVFAVCHVIKDNSL